jgi:hypothetical protein
MIRVDRGRTTAALALLFGQVAMSDGGFGSGGVLERRRAVLTFATAPRPAQRRASFDTPTPSPVERPADCAELPVIARIVRPTAVERAPVKSAAIWVGGAIAVMAALATAANAVHRSVEDAAAARASSARSSMSTAAEFRLVRVTPEVRIEATHGVAPASAPDRRR